MAKKIKKLNQVQKLKIEIKKLSNDLRSMERDKEYYRGKYESIKEDSENEISLMSRKLNKNENMFFEQTNKLESEILWLRRTLENVVIDPKRLKDIDELQNKQIITQGMRY